MFNLKNRLNKLSNCGGLWLLFLLAITAICWFPLIRYPGRYGNMGDWDMFLAFYESVRKTIVEYGQFPFWNPWHFGGTPLFANPQLAVIGLETPFIIIFGTVYGLSLAMFVYELLGALGMWLLLGDYVNNNVSRFWGSLVFALSGALSLHIAAGHPVMVSIVFLPWMLYFLRRLKEQRSSALWFGFTAGMLINHSLHYVSLSIASFILIYGLYLLCKNFKTHTFWLNATLAGMMFIAVASCRIIATFQLLREFPRTIEARADVAFHNYILALLYPGQSLSTFPEILKLYWGWFEIGCYVGSIALLMFLVSIIREIKWWHWGFLICSMLTLNSTCKFLPGYWLREIPPFTSFFCITRWRFIVMFFIAIGCCRGFDWLYDNCKEKGVHKRLYFLLLISVTGLIYNQYCNWRDVAWISVDTMMAAVTQSSDTILTVNNHQYSRYASVHNGLAQLFAYEPLLGYAMDYKNKRLFHGSPCYKGEFFPLKGTISDILWSPNYIEISCSEPSTILINSNPGNYWRGLTGEKLFPMLKGFDTSKHFLIDIPHAGKMILYLRPPWYEFALIISFSSAILLLLMLFVLRIFDRRKDNSLAGNKQ